MMGGMGIFEFPAMIEPDGSMGNLIVAITGVLLTMAIAFVATIIFYKETTGEEKEETAESNEKEENASAILKRAEIGSPVKGKALKLSSIRDDAFASGVLGKGAAVLPEEGKVFAPADGEVTALFPTMHAIGIKTDEGAEILIHIGLDTVQLNGEGFEAAVSCGDRVKKGQLMIKFDKEWIEGKGYCLETPVIITNSDDFLDVVDMAQEKLEPGDSLLQVLK